MNYRAEKQSFTGIGLVVLVHIAVGYALLQGMARTIIEREPRPSDVTLIPEPLKPRPEVDPPKARHVPVPNTAYVPPPDIVIQAPNDSPPAIDTRTTVPTDPATIGSPTDGAQVAAIGPIVRKEFKAAYRVDPIFPRIAQREGFGGRVTARLHVTPEGTVSQVQIMYSSHRVFEREVARALSQWKFRPEPVGFIGEYEIAFNLGD